MLPIEYTKNVDGLNVTFKNFYVHTVNGEPYTELVDSEDLYAIMCMCDVVKLVSKEISVEINPSFSIVNDCLDFIATRAIENIPDWTLDRLYGKN